MMARVFVACLLMLGGATVAAAQSEPWTVYGQTAPICQGSVRNPKPNVNGLLGEVTALPYVVPDGKVLIVEAYGVEAYSTVPGGIVLVPYLGVTPPVPNNAFLHSVFADNHSNETTGVAFHLPAGKIFNLLIMSSECWAGQVPGTAGMVVGWYVKGQLVSAR